MTVNELINYMVDTYGVRSCHNNDDDEDTWFECPECYEPIYVPADWSIDEILATGCCPVCEQQIIGG